MITKLSQIVEEAQKKGRKRLAVAYGQDSHTLSAVYDAYNEGLVEPTLYGDKQVIEEVCGAEGIDCSIFKIVDEKSDVNCVRLAVAAVVAGDADVLMKGLVSTDKYMRGILNKDAGLFPPKGVLSHVAILEMPSLPKLLCISDVAVIPAPDFKQKQKLIGYLIQTARLLGIDTPKIACIAPSEQVLPSVPSSTEGAILAKMDRCRWTWRSTRRSPSTRKSRVRPSRAIPTACSSPTSNRPTSSSRQPRISAAPSWRPWSWERRFPACSPRAATRA